MVIKFTPEGRVDMVFGSKQEASDEDTAPVKKAMSSKPPDDGFFRQVTDVAWDAADPTYISDGYINSRIGKVDKDGNWLTSWGEPGDKPGQLNTLPEGLRIKRACDHTAYSGSSNPSTKMRSITVIEPHMPEHSCDIASKDAWASQ